MKSNKTNKIFHQVVRELNETNGLMCNDDQELEKKPSIEIKTGTLKFLGLQNRISKYAIVNHECENYIESTCNLLFKKWKLNRPHLILSVTGGN